MSNPSFQRTPAHELAAHLGVPVDAVTLARQSDFIDLHLDGFIWTRLMGYDLGRRHRRPVSGGRFVGHLDFPRALDAGLSGGLWSITTNPFRSQGGRRRALAKNLAQLKSIVANNGDVVELARSVSDHARIRDAGKHAVFIALQGGNALDPTRSMQSQGMDDVVAVTLVHLLSSSIGRTSTPSLPKSPALTPAGETLIEVLEAHGVLVDLAHIHPDAFARAVAVHDKSKPLVSTHTGVNGVTPHWRNLSDDQVKTIANSGGVVGIIFEPNFVVRRGGPTDVEMVVEHILHALDVGGEDAPAIGSDYDGMIVPPRDLRDGLALPRLVHAMTKRGLKPRVVEKILGGNFLACLSRVRP